ncbi:MAG: type III-B CRISPR module RAMP protein Cmr1 [Verrucomicrobia bacterium]|nr:type III-B CRISPR module RAMP protein Cmr1 [Verrucomicrobiota bacterium]
MKTETFHLELITPCFCGGAEPEKQAEIRAPSIRGQLRWWFRTLGGFKSLAARGLSVRAQEALIFGSTAGEEGQAGKLVVRVKNGPAPSTTTRDDREFHAEVGTDRGYLAFPLRSKRKRENGMERLVEYKGKAAYDWEDSKGNKLALPTFDLQLIWRGDLANWPDIEALVVVFGNLGALGFRSRRALGALRIASHSTSQHLTLALDRFGKHTNQHDWQSRICITEATARPPNAPYVNRSADDCIVTLARWLKDWRSHGRTVDHATARPPNPPHNSGFDPFAKNDHDRGVAVGLREGSPNDQTFRPALGLPIIQFFSSGKPQVDWNERWDPEKARRNRNYKGEGRFASPILLRPHRDAAGNWHALVIFVDAHKWPRDKQVYLNGQPRRVSLDLYNQMKQDRHLTPFP